MIGFLLLAASGVLLVVGAEVFVDNATGAAARLGVTVLAVGLLLAGAEPEELLTAAIAAGQDHPGLAAGDAIGANVTMLTATLGLAALVRPVPFGRRVREYAVLAGVAGVAAVLVLLDGRVDRLEGGGLLAAYVTLVALIWWREREPPKLGELADVDGAAPDRSAALALGLAIAGIGLMLVGGDLAVRGATRVLDALHARESAVGLTFLALATTAELFALVLAAARRGANEIAVAGVVGSAAYNATATLGAAALVRPLRVDGVLGPAVLAAALPLVLVALTGRSGRLGRPMGLALGATYAGFAVLVLR